LYYPSKVKFILLFSGRRNLRFKEIFLRLCHFSLSRQPKQIIEEVCVAGEENKG
jgi:hypothetical protein